LIALLNNIRNCLSKADEEIDMSVHNRSPFQQKVVEALVESKAIDFEQIGATLSRFSLDAALRGESLVQIINRNVMWNCGWPGPELDIFRHEAGRAGQ
jgi:hypothetical protein